ncbi:MAG: hypothetical protein AAFY38_03155 [Pseudomonadota bacterium]
MNDQITPPVFLERRGYRRRRMLDALRILPLAGSGLMLMPLLWPANWTEAGGPVSMSGAILYIFGVWLLLIAVSAVLWYLLREPPEPRE